MTYDLFNQQICGHEAKPVTKLFRVHKRESNPSNEKILENGREHFSKNCRTLFEAFMRGEIINTFNSPVPEFRRRRQDLTDENGVKISLHPTSSGRLKNWYMSEQDKIHNEKFR